jgi:hypothetical protein
MSARDEARALWKSDGLSFNDLDDGDLSALHETLDRHMRSSDIFDGSLRMSGTPAVWTSSNRGRTATMLCDANHFKDREAVTFHADGYIGFCGWASDRNDAPFLSAFEEWLGELHHERNAAP